MTDYTIDDEWECYQTRLLQTIFLTKYTNEILVNIADIVCTMHNKFAIPTFSQTA